MAKINLAELARKAKADRLPPTEEQSEILEHVRSTSTNLVINALAGTGKTTTLEMVQSVSRQQPVLYLAFNTKVAKEAEEKFSSTTTVRTLNALGHRVWMAGRSVNLNAKKTQDLLREMIKEMPKEAAKEVWESFWQVVEGVSMAKALGYIPKGKYRNVQPLTNKATLHASLEEKPDELTSDLIDAVLALSIQTAFDGYIDFNDQLYMPTLFGGTFPRYPLVMGDEAQDFSPLNHAMLDKLARGRLIAVGDPWQSIYAFRGAKTRSMQELTNRFKAETFTLSLCFRCPKPIVEAARWRAPALRWAKEEGTYEILRDLRRTDILENSAIICRNNAPLFRLAMQLLQAGRSVAIAGSEIGPKIISIMRRLGSEDMSAAQVMSAIENWRSAKKDRESKTADDIAECMKVFAGFGKTLSLAVAHAEHLFKQRGTITLTTGHKAKGLEFNTVYHLDPWLCRMDDDQDKNLKYVITTRAKQSLYEIDSERIR
jgi:superfamily I DNA/RNA helicase